jgi:[ribosomal protein S18]-alanine N-acetyltransferase
MSVNSLASIRNHFIMNVSIQPLDSANAREIISWHYPTPYDMYNIRSDNLEAEIAYFTNPDNHYYAIFNPNHTLIGFCCFFHEGQVSGGDYSDEAVDVGMGLRPELTGGGNGTEIARAVMDFAIAQYHPLRLRTTIAAWNERAQKVCLNNGFELVDRFTHPRTYQEFVILAREII